MRAQNHFLATHAEILAAIVALAVFIVAAGVSLIG